MSNNGGNLTIQYNLRWSEEMRDKIAAAAKENTRSMNQEIIARLEQSFENDQSSYMEAFTEAGIKILSHVMTSLKAKGMNDEQIKDIFQGLRVDKNE